MVANRILSPTDVILEVVLPVSPYREACVYIALFLSKPQHFTNITHLLFIDEVAEPRSGSVAFPENSLKSVLGLTLPLAGDREKLGYSVH